MTRERLSTTFWGLAGDRGLLAVSVEPVDVVRVFLAVLDGLEGRTTGSQVAANALSFLLRLEHEPHYASPEQTRGGEKDSRALVYSVGVLLFEKLTGHHPFVESLSPVEAAMVRDRCSVRGGANNLCSLPGHLRTILGRAMSPFAEDRYANITEMRAELETFVAREQASSQMTARPRAISEMPRAPRRRTTPPPPPGSVERTSFERRRESAMRLIFVPPPAPSDATAAEQWPMLPPPKTVSPHVIRRSRSRVAVGVSLGGVAVAALIGLVAVQTGGSDGDARAADTPAETAIPAAAHTIPTFTVRAARPDVLDDTPDDAEAEIVEAVEEPAPFDIAEGGATTLDTARDCLSARRLRAGVQIGVSLHYASGDGASDRVYLANNPISASESRCLRTNLIGLHAGGVPPRATTVTYNLWITETTGRHRARVAR